MARKRFFKKFTFVLIAASLLVAAGCSGFPGSGQPTGSAVAQTGLVSSTTVSDNVETSGTLEAFQDAKLFWRTTGTVADVKIKPGDRVKTGDVIMSLDPTSLPANVLSAQADLINAQQQLEDLNPTALAISQAEQKIVAAQDVVKHKQDVVNNLGTPARQADIDQAKATVLLAKIQMDKAWDRYEPWKNKSENNAVRAMLYNRWAQAQQQYDSAVRRLNNLLGQGVNELDRQLAEADLNLAQANLVDAQEKLAELKAGANAQDIAALQARITAAQATLNAQEITAPFDGEILVVNFQPGDVVSTNEAAVVLANRDQMHVDAQIDEVEIGRVALGAPATITLDAFPGQELTGKISLINPMGETVQGNVKYNVRIDLDPVENPLLLGATANVIIQTGKPAEVALVPVRAIQTDDNGEFVNLILPDGTFKRVAVTTGRLVGDQVIVLDNDLQVGQQLQLPAITNEMMDRMNNMGQ